jgi:ABC-type phosphonate transport system ATPase subunit
MVGSKVMALSNPYPDLERRYLHLTEWGFHIYSKENGLRKLV